MGKRAENGDAEDSSSAETWCRIPPVARLGKAWEQVAGEQVKRGAGPAFAMLRRGKTRLRDASVFARLRRVESARQDWEDGKARLVIFLFWDLTEGNEGNKDGAGRNVAENC